MKDRKLIIGITGFTGSGKDTVADYLKDKGFCYTSLSDVIREECIRRGLSTERDNLIRVGNELREKFGFEEIARRSLEEIKESKSDRFVVVSIRHPQEVDYLRQQGGLHLVTVEAPLELRYERNSKRGRPEDSVSLEKFKEQEERERLGEGAQQQLNKVTLKADFRIDNSGSLEDLYQQVEKVLEEISNRL
jgi:dephospho-CoA kinase